MSFRNLLRSRYFRRKQNAQRPKNSALRSHVPLLVEFLEGRWAPAVTTLANGSGDGSVSVRVDAYGSFGSAASPAGDAFYDPFGPIGPSATVFQSGLFFKPLGNFLTESSFFGGGLPSITFTSTTATTATSTFSVAGFSITLTQTMSPVGPGGTTLTQTYAITNNTGSPQTFNVVRFVDGDLYMVGNFMDDDGGVSKDGKTLFEFDSASAAITNFVGISEPLGNDIRWTIHRYPFAGNIVSAGGIPANSLNQIGDGSGNPTGGDPNGDGITDNPFDVTISLEEFITLAVGGTATYTTVTFWGERGETDLALTKTDSPDPVFLGQDLTYVLNVTNNGPGAATGVTLVDTLPSDVSFVSSVPSQGSSSFSNNVVTCDLGDMQPGDQATVTIIVTPLTGGQLTNTAVVSENEDEINPANNTATAITLIYETFSIDDVTLSEGPAATANAIFTVTMSPVANVPTTIQFSTADGTATAGSDYQSSSGILTFAPGETTQTITVTVNNDFLVEPTETFVLNLTNQPNAIFANDKNFGTGTILDDDVAVGQSFTEADGDTVKVVLKGGGSIASLTLSDPNHDGYGPLQIALQDTTLKSKLTIKVSRSVGTDGLMSLAAIQTDGPMGSIIAQTSDLSDNGIAVGGMIKMLELHDVSNATITAQSVGNLIITGDLTDSLILAGANLGADHALGGSGAYADTFGFGIINHFEVRGVAIHSIVGAGLNPVDGVFQNGNDVVTGAIKSFSIANGATLDNYFAAGLLPSRVRIDGFIINPYTDPRFLFINPCS